MRYDVDQHETALRRSPRHRVSDLISAPRHRQANSRPLGTTKQDLPSAHDPLGAHGLRHRAHAPRDRRPAQEENEPRRLPLDDRDVAAAMWHCSYWRLRVEGFTRIPEPSAASNSGDARSRPSHAAARPESGWLLSGNLDAAGGFVYVHLADDGDATSNAPTLVKHNSGILLSEQNDEHHRRSRSDRCCRRLSRTPSLRNVL
jgi:hypothetical protein